MAVRFSADGQDFTRTLSLGSLTQWSVCGWYKISTDRNTLVDFWSLDAGSGDYSVLGTEADGTSLYYFDTAGSVSLTVNATVGTWYYVGIAVNGANLTAIVRAATASSFTAVTSSSLIGSVTATNLRIGEDSVGGLWLNGCEAAVKLWTGATLTQAEMENEAWTYLPKRTSNLKAWYPFDQASTVDYSGNAQTLSGGSGATTEDGPPIQWGGQSPIVLLPSVVNATATPSAVAAVAAVPTPTVTTGSSVTASAVASVAAVPVPTLSTGSTLTPDAVPAVVAVPTPTVTTGAVTSVAPDAVATTVGVPAASVSAGAVVVASPVVTTVAIPSPSLSTSAVVAAATVAAVVRIPLPSVTVPILPGDLITGDYQIEINTELLLGPQTYRIISVSGWDDLVDLDVGDVMRPARHGAWPGRKLAQERLLSTNLVIDDQESFLESLQALRRATAVPDDDTEIPIVVRTRGETLIAYGAIDARVLPPDTWYAGVAQAALRWRCSDPRRYSLSVGSIVIANGTSDAATNDGDTLTHPTVRIAGPATNPSVYNQTTDRTLAFTITLGSNDTLVVDTNAGTVRLGSTDRMSALAPLSVPVEEWFLQMGTNIVSYSATSGGSAGVEVQWRSAFL